MLKLYSLSRTGQKPAENVDTYQNGNGVSHLWEDHHLRMSVMLIFMKAYFLNVNKSESLLILDA